MTLGQHIIGLSHPGICCRWHLAGISTFVFLFSFSYSLRLFVSDGVHLGGYFSLCQNRICLLRLQLIECAIIFPIFLIHFQYRKRVFIRFSLCYHLSYTLSILNRSQIYVQRLFLFVGCCLESSLYFLEGVARLIVKFWIGREIIRICRQNIRRLIPLVMCYVFNTRLPHLRNLYLMFLMATRSIKHFQSRSQHTLHSLMLTLRRSSPYIVSDCLRVDHVQTAFLDLVILRFFLFPFCSEFKVSRIIGPSTGCQLLRAANQKARISKGGA